MILGGKIGGDPTLYNTQGINNLKDGRDQYQNVMHMSQSYQRPARLHRIQNDWEAQLPNDREHYQSSPVAKFAH